MVTTTENIGQSAGPGPCVRCGRYGGILERGFSDHSLVHAFGVCPEEGVESPGGMDVAHDALGVGDGASLLALEALEEKGVVITRQKSVGPTVAEVHESIIGRPGVTVLEDGRAYSDTRRADLRRARREHEASGFKPSFPSESAEEDAYLRGAARPLGAGRRKVRSS